MADPLVKGWHLEELAMYEHFVDPTAAQRTLAAARKLNAGVLKPAVPPSRKKVAGPAAQGKAAAAYLGATYSDARTLQLAVASIFDNVVWGVPGTSDLAEEQGRLRALHLGFGSIRPEKEDRDGGPDNLWALSHKRYAVIEVKTEVSRDDPVIIKSEAEQLGHSMTWFAETYPDEFEAIPVLLHPSNELDAQAHVPAGSRVVTRTDLEGLRVDVEAYAKELAASDAWTDAQTVAATLARHQLTADRIIARHSAAIRRSVS